MSDSAPSSSNNAATAAAPTITIVERCTLQCATPSSLQQVASPMSLGPIDSWQVPFVPIAAVFVYRFGEGGSLPVDVPRLHRALRRLLDYYPHLTGRLTHNEEDGSPEIHQLGTGVEVLTAECDASLTSFESVSSANTPAGAAPSSLSVTDLPGGGTALLAPFDPMAFASESILTVQHTRFSCGSASLGVRLRHMVCDADGFFQLCRDLAELYRALHTAHLAADQPTDAPAVHLSHPPRIRSYLSDLRTSMSAEERQAALEFDSAIFKVPAPMVPATTAAASANVPLSLPPPVTGRVLRFSAEELALLKSEANTGATSALSTFDALSAHLQQCLFRARFLHLRASSSDLSVEEALSRIPRWFLGAKNWRGSRGLPDLPPRYFPNAIFMNIFTLPSQMLLDAPLAEVAAALHEQVHAMRVTDAERTLRWISAQPNKRLVQLNYPFHEGGIIVTSWTRCDMYPGMVFDEGAPPVLVAPPFSTRDGHAFDGVAILMPTPDQVSAPHEAVGTTHQHSTPTGSIDVYLAISEPLWSVLDQDKRLRRHLSRS